MKFIIMKTILLILSSFAFIVTNAQTTWYEIPTGVHNKLNTIDFPSSLVGYIGGNDTLLLKTTDGGNNWSPVDFSGVTVYAGGENILDLNFIDENIGYMTVGPYGGTYKTIDGGLNWDIITVSLNLCYVGGTFFFDEDDGFIGGDGCFEGELIDIVAAGTTTASIMNYNGMAGGESITQIDFLDDNYGLASSSGGRIFRTINSGVTWDSIPSSLGNTVPITSVKIINDTLAFAGYNQDGGGFALLTTTDAGLTWSQDLATGTFYYPAFYEIVHSNSNHIYVAAVPSFGELGVIFENDGTFWNYWNVDHPVYAMDTYSDSIAWAVGDSGYVVVNVPPTMLTLTENTINATLNVYPNPFKSTINLDFTGFTSPNLTIIDSQGRVILERVVNIPQQDLLFLEKGIYIMKLTEGDRERTARVIKY
ncbi:MAG: photosystem II stability/assembly factor-like uncharacterized protein [Crocinitomix sp.]|jgi:photosystem II stability/assembly factor-like uncharacterized protein